MPENSVLREATFDPKVKTYFMSHTILLCIVTVVGIPLLLIVIPFGFALIQKWLDRLGCTLTTRTLEIRKGVFNKVESTIPLEKITDLQLYQGPLMRMLGIEGFRVETAGQSSVPGGSLVNMVGIVDTRGFREAVLAQRDRHAADPSPATSPIHHASPPSNEHIELMRETVKLLRQIDEKIPDRTDII